MLVAINIDSLMCGARCGKLHRTPSQLMFALQQSMIDSQLFVNAESRSVPTPTAFDAPVMGVPAGILP